MKVLIVDDHAVMRAGTRLILQDVWAGIIFDEAGCGNEALRMVHDNDYDVVLMGLTLPDNHGLELLRGIKRKKPGLPVIIVSLHDEERYAVKAYALGADGYISKRGTPVNLIQAVGKVLRGGKYISEHLMDAVVTELSNVKAAEQASSSPIPLSNREKQIAQMLVSGATNKEIAWQLSISVKTVSTHKTRVLKKLNLRNLSQLITHSLATTSSNHGGNWPGSGSLS